jgi:hypothetical protein
MDSFSPRLNNPKILQNRFSDLKNTIRKLLPVSICNFENGDDKSVTFEGLGGTPDVGMCIEQQSNLLYLQVVI